MFLTLCFVNCEIGDLLSFTIHLMEESFEGYPILVVGRTMVPFTDGFFEVAGLEKDEVGLVYRLPFAFALAGCVPVWHHNQPGLLRY